MLAGLLFELWPFVALFYLFESVIRVRCHQFAFVRHGLGRWRVARPSWRIDALSPLAELVVIDDWRSALAGDSVRLLDGECRERGRLPLSEIERFVPDRRRVRARTASEERVVFVTAGVQAARRIAATLEDVRVAVAPARAVSEAALVRSRAAAFEGARSPALQVLKGAGAALFVIGFVSLPLALYTGHQRDTIPVQAALAAAAYACAIASAWVWLGHEGLSASARLGRLAPAIAFPPQAVHLAALLGSELRAGTTPLGCAGALLDPADFAVFARREYHRHRLAAAVTGGGHGAERMAEWASCVQAMGLDDGRLRTAPDPDGDDAARYCPLCEQQYRSDADACSDCVVPLEDL